jgi:hypothetical protein
MNLYLSETVNTLYNFTYTECCTAYYIFSYNKTLLSTLKNKYTVASRPHNLQLENVSPHSSKTVQLRGHAVAQLVEALCYKWEGCGSIPDEVIAFFN